MGARIDAHDDLWPRAPENWEENDVLDLVDAHPIDDDRWRWAGPAIAASVAVVWVGGLLWLARDSLSSLPPVDLAQFLAALCIAPTLIGIVWLLARRTSRAEARRFGASAQAMRSEAAALERRVASLTRVLASQREQLTVQLDASAAAAARFETIGRAMAQEVHQAEAQATALADTAERARGTVGELIASMPRARAESEEVGRRLDQAGLTAAAQAAALEAQLVALGARARDSDEHAAGAADRLAAHIARMDAVGEQAGARLEQATATAAAALDALVETATRRLDQQIQNLDATGSMAGGRLELVASDLAISVDAIIGRTERATEVARLELAQQGETMLAGLNKHQTALDAAGRDSVEALTIRLDEVDIAIDRIAGRLGKQRIAGQEMVGELVDGLGHVERQLDTLHISGTERTQILAASISALGGSADAMSEALRSGDMIAARTIGTTESLLVALDAAAREIDETLPDALGRLDTRVDDSRRLIAHAKPELLALVTAAESTHDAIEAVAGVIADQRRTLDQLSGTLLETLAAGRAKAGELGEAIDDTIGRTHRLADEAAPRLVEALLRVRETAQVAADRARETLAGIIPEAAATLERATAEAMRRATTDTVERQVEAIGDATQVAVDAATRATERLAGHIDTISEQSALLDARIEKAQSDREAADGDSIARRVALLIDALNSASIDIVKAFAPDVSDSAWGAYLKGDRGVFTRRAVRLLEASDAARISYFYDSDADFRDQVNRYIHDFETMLRAILAQREGSPLGVTLLSSDMGKLYVALAQAIDRLR
ncbi:hypothetical protein ASG67_04635 [Sphingomonas sp. Leaf339]|uniref:hypothetical protein n=1 Tax=Sphingomonas sp. Leaf339 TaxID=1736343 RepID=UPI0006F67ABC|nr:hypothetical protein [Sphingomonas sp. Leaf339]KQU62378.1 hypothetical protein ASG67_04635 [Sphingomonas sp. Leaf339]